MPTMNERYGLERLADYILAEDNARGLSLRTRANMEANKDEDYPEIGSVARLHQERIYFLECTGRTLTEDEQRRVKVCAVCGCEFIDRSRRLNTKTCRYPCVGTYDTLRKRRERNAGEVRLLRYRDRQDLEYPFYSPAELYEISQRGETIIKDIGDVMTIAKLRQERGRRIPTEFNMDNDDGYFPNEHKRWRSQEDAESLSGPVITYNLNDVEEPEKELYIGHAS